MRGPRQAKSRRPGDKPPSAANAQADWARRTANTGLRPVRQTSSNRTDAKEDPPTGAARKAPADRQERVILLDVADCLEAKWAPDPPG